MRRVSFVGDGYRGTVLGALRGSEHFVVADIPQEARAKGGLREVLEDAIESALAMRGALPPSSFEAMSEEDIIADQVFRAKALGVEGLAIGLPSLTDMFGEARLSAEDSRTLHAWLAAARKGLVTVLLDERDRSLELIAPVALSELVDVSSTKVRDSKQGASPKAKALGVAKAPPQEVVSGDPPSLPQSDAHRTDARLLNASEWRAYAVELDRESGPRPIRVVERLFQTRYMPLLQATLWGEVDVAVKNVVTDWRASFEHSYRESFSAIRATGKRPPMVFDAPEIAGKAGRLNGARTVTLLLIDSMRFDLGEMIMSEIKDRTLGRAVCVDKTLLWSALPTTTPMQLALLAHGASGLRDVAPPSDRELEVVRGRAVSTIRRERVGIREILKLDLLEARLKAPGLDYEERVAGATSEAAEIVAKFIETLPPRTLLYIFGDHGFRVKQGATASAPTISQGGSSPEEVLVPAYAWLVGGVH